MPHHDHDHHSAQPHDHDQPRGNNDLVVVVGREQETVRHPLDPLTAEEIDAARAILVEAGLLGETVRVPMLLPHEPEKDELAAWTPG
ncbi:MAG: hypothetical protein ABWY26_11810, partial [Microbacterium sp.]